MRLTDIHQWVDALFGMEDANVVVTGPDGAHLASLELMGSPEIEVQTGEYFPQFGISLTNKIGAGAFDAVALGLPPYNGL